MYNEVFHYWQRSGNSSRSGPLVGMLSTVFSICIAAISLVGCVNTQPAHSQDIILPQRDPAVETEHRSFVLRDQAVPTLIIYNTTGFIHAHAGNNMHAMDVTVTKTAGLSGEPISNLKLNYSQNDNTITIQVEHLNPNLLKDARTDIDVVLPDRSDLQLQTEVGPIAVVGIKGKMNLMDRSGPIAATRVLLTEDSQFRTNVGSIHFQGTISPGQYKFQTIVGDVVAALPSTAHFHVSGSTFIGLITSDFPTVVVQHGILGASVNSDVSSDPATAVTLTTRTGSLYLHAAS